MRGRIAPLGLALTAAAMTTQAARAQDFCFNWGGTGSCHATREAAEAALREVLPASYRRVLRPKSPYPIGNGPNAQGLERWRVDYFIPDQPPERINPAGFSQGWAGADAGVCPSAGDPLYPYLCKTESSAANALYNHFVASYPQCTFRPHGYENAYAVPFGAIQEYGYRSRWGVITYGRALPPAAERKFVYDIQCPGWAQPVVREINLSKMQTFLCPDKFTPLRGFGSLAYSPNGGGQVLASPKCQPIEAMPQLTFLQKGTGSCEAGTKPGPCHPATGDKSRNEVDFDFSGEPFTRHYHSTRQTGMVPPLAPGWTHTWSDRILDGGTYNLRMIRADGNIEYFLPLGGNQFKSSETARKKLVKLADGTYRIYDESGGVQSFNTVGRLVRTERSATGLAFIEFTYEGDKLARAQDHTGRALRFFYLEDRLHTIELPDAQVVEYEFDDAGNLTLAILADGTNKQYHYNEAGLSLANDPHALTGITAEDGLRYSSYGYAANGRVNLSQRHKGDGTFVERTTIDYSNLQQPVVTLPSGEVVTYGIVDQGPYRRVVSQVGQSANMTASYLSGGTNAGLGQVALLGQVEKFVYAADYLSTRYEAFGTPEERRFVTVRDTQYRITSYEVQAKSGTGYVTLAKQVSTYNARGQLTTTSRLDPTSTATRTVTLGYCEPADVSAGTCPLVGLLRTIDGPRTDVADVTTFTYYTSDAPGCVPGQVPCSYRKADLRSITNALGQATEILGYDDAGRRAAVLDPAGVVTEFEYDPRGRMTAWKVRGPDGAVETDDRIVRIAYRPTGLVEQVTDADGSFTRYEYDDAQRLTDILDHEGNRISYGLNGASERVQESVRDDQGTLMRTLARTFDSVSQVASQFDAFDRSWQFTYDAHGNLETETDALGRRTEHDHDPLNRLVRTLADVAGIAASNHFAYDGLDRLTSVTDPKGLVTTYRYDGLGNLVERDSPDTGTTQFTHDAAGFLTSQTDARGITANLTYDALGRVTHVGHGAAGSGVTYTYDMEASGDCAAAGEGFLIGRLALVSDASGTTQFCYDRFGNLARKIQTTGGRPFTQRYVYDPAGRLTRLHYPDGAVVDYVYDAQGRVIEVGAKPAAGSRQVLLTQVTYHPFGSVAGWSYGNLRGMSREVNQNYQPSAIAVTGSGGLNLGYQFDAVGNLEALRTAGPGNPPRRLFDYDALDRLTGTRDGLTLDLLAGYTYDATGNRTSASRRIEVPAGPGGGSGTFTLQSTLYGYGSGNHQLVQVGGEPRAYDDAGNLFAIGDAQQTGGSTAVFTYDAQGRMNGVQMSSGQALAFVHNGNGELVRQTGAGIDRTFLYDANGRWLGEYGASGTPTQQILWFDDLPVGLWVGSGGQQKLYYIEPDALGSPRVVIDPTRGAQGTAVWTWDAAGEAFGATPPNENPDGDGLGFRFDLRFPGQRFDPVSGLSYNYLRDSYEPATGRYSQSDPIGLEGGLSTYAYAGSNPLNTVDPMGLFKPTPLPTTTPRPPTTTPPVPTPRLPTPATRVLTWVGRGLPALRAAGTAWDVGSFVGDTINGAIEANLGSPGTALFDLIHPETYDRDIWTPERTPRHWTCKARADCNDNMVGNCPDNPKRRFAFGGGIAKTLGEARDIAKKNAVHNLQCKQKRHVSCVCVGPTGGKPYRGGC